MRPLRTIAIAMADELIIESPIIKKWTRKIILYLFLSLFNKSKIKIIIPPHSYT